MYDVIVVGGGIIGLSAARHVAKSGSKTLLIDQYPLPHSHGSSHGKSRGIRHTYETLHHVKMMPEAFEEWRKLEDETKSKLLIKSGILCLCDDHERFTMARNIAQVNVDCKLLSGEKIEQMFPGFKTNGMNGIFEAEAGILKADECLWALKASFLLAGGCMEQGIVMRVEPVDDKTVNIHTNREVYTARSVILTCGPWINDLLQPLQLHLPIVIKRSLIIYWKTKSASSYLCENFPLTCVTKPNDLIYAVPVCEYPGYVKIGLHRGSEIRHASDRDKLGESDVEKEADQLKALKALIKEHYPEVVPEPCFSQNCLYSSTPDEDFILDCHPRFSNVVIGAGFSGHGFKLAPVIGSILGNLALEQKQKYFLDPFLLRRFRGKPVAKSSL